MLVLKNYKVSGGKIIPVNYSQDGESVVFLKAKIAIFDNEKEYKDPVLVKQENVPFDIIMEKEELEKYLSKENKEESKEE